MNDLTHIIKKFMEPFFQEVAPVLGIAVSGGMDSMALLHAASALSFPIKVLHVNFQLRGEESEGDRKFVEEQALQLGHQFLLKNVDTERLQSGSGKSIQMVAREQRYQWFEEILNNNEVDFILLAHHQDDQAETVLLNLVRGTRLSGLYSMRSSRGKYLRPLLGVNRSDIEQWMVHYGISHREDSSNSKTAYKRNKLRHEVMPRLRELNPSVSESIQRFSEHMSELAPWVAEGVRQLKKLADIEGSTIRIPIEKTRVFPGAKYLLYEWAIELDIDTPSLLWDQLQAEVGTLNISGGRRILTDRDNLIIRNEEEPKGGELVEEVPEMEGLWEGEVSLNFRYLERVPSQLDFGPNTAVIDADRISFPLTVRPWRDGDRFIPLGMSGMKKVQDFFTDIKLDRNQKKEVRLLCSGSQIVWIIGLRMDDRFKVVDTTEKVYLVQLLSNFK